MKHTLTFAALVAVAFVLGACAGTGDTPVAPTAAVTSQTSPAATTASATPPVSSFKETAKADPATVTPYPFTTCAVIRKDLKGSPKYRRVYKNQEVIFCCTPCLKAFDTNPEPYMPRIIEAAAAKARGETVNSGW